ncbi:MAG TPA: hypothetical protein VKM94_23505 [Blastocatellia bacterium]|nr:hypothetical protein [Blastocatellia bacterium]
MAGSNHPAAPKIMLIRHAEKPPNNPPPHGINENGDHDKESLTVVGWQRAGALVVFFAPSLGEPQNPQISVPSFIYASQTTKGNASDRPQQTVSPLIEKLAQKVSVNFKFARGEESKVAGSAMEKNGPVLICWDHEHIPDIARHLPISSSNSNPVPSEWPDDRYDLVWVFDLNPSDCGYCFVQVPQLLLSGDVG